MFICEEHGEKWNRDTGCPYCRERKLEQQLAALRLDYISAVGQAQEALEELLCGRISDEET